MSSEVRLCGRSSVAVAWMAKLAVVRLRVLLLGRLAHGHCSAALARDPGEAVPDRQHQDLRQRAQNQQEQRPRAQLVGEASANLVLDRSRQVVIDQVVQPDCHRPQGGINPAKRVGIDGVEIDERDPDVVGVEDTACRREEQQDGDSDPRPREGKYDWSSCNELQLIALLDQR